MLMMFVVCAWASISLIVDCVCIEFDDVLCVGG